MQAMPRASSSFELGAFFWDFWAKKMGEGEKL
jgi:hypothetical protein